MIAVILFATAILLAWLALRIKVAPVDLTRNVLFVTAHPDDELMFFGPTLLREIQARADDLTRSQSDKPHSKVHLLCLSNGDFYGDGVRRSQELSDACEFLLDYSYNFTSKQRDEEIFEWKAISDAQLPDSPKARWPSSLITHYVSAYIKKNNISKVISFDEHGVSGHVNHISIYEALVNSSLSPSIELWKIESVALWRKYLFFLDIVLTCVQSIFRSSLHLNVVSPRDYIYLVQALRCHQSQMLWFRYLYSFGSRFMYVNTLSRYE